MRLGAFELLEPLGQGAMGRVWRGRHDSGVPAAVKVLERSEPEHHALFAEEVRAVAGLDHPCIVQVHDHGHVPEGHALVAGRPWLAMELVEGGPLDLAPRSWPELQRVLADLLEGLAHAHALGVLHRDLKPDNVLVADCARLADFGLAGRLGAAWGTPAYMAPEQVEGDPGRQGPWTDLYALGCLGWALCCGEPPFSGTTEEVLGAQVFDDLPPFAPRAELPPEVEGWLRGLLEKAPEDRPQLAADARAALGDLERRPHRGRPLSAGLGLYGLRRIPLSGRRGEWARLEGALRGAGLQRVLLRGPAGAGKTRLADELARHAHEQGLARVFRAVHGPTGGPTDGLVPMLRGHLRDDDPLLTEELKPRERDARIRRVLEQADRRLLVLLDDVQWGPDALRWAAALKDLDALVLATAREDLLPATPDGFEALELRPLPAADHEALVATLLGLSGALAERVAERTSGNPLFAVQLVADWVRRSILVAAPGGFALAEGAEVPLPDDLHALFAGRVQAPSVELAAVLGEHVEEEEWARACAAAELEPVEVDGLVLERLATREPGRWHFAHGLLRETLLRQASDGGRLGAWHAACAEAVVEHERKARHLVACGRRDEALDSFLVALTRRVTTGDFSELEQLSEEVAALCDEGDPRRGRALSQRVRADLGRGRHDAALARARDLLELTLEHDWPLSEAHVRLDLGRIARQQGRHDEAWQHLVRGRERALDAGDGDLAHRMRETQGWVLLDRGELERARAHFSEALAGFQAHGNELGEAVTQLALAGVDMKAGATDGIVERLDRAALLYGRHKDRWGLGSVATEAGEYHRLRGDLDEADRCYAEGYARYSEIGSAMAAIAQLNLGLVRVERGAWEEAVEVFEDAERELTRQGRRAYLAAVHAGLLPCLLALGDLAGFDERMALAEQAIADTGFADPDLARLGERAAAMTSGERAERAGAFAADQWRRLGR